MQFGIDVIENAVD